MSKLLTIYSSEEKIGKTTFGINLGVSLSNETQKSVVLVDLSAHENRVPAWSMLKLPPRKPLQDHNLTTERVKECLLTHSSQLSILTVDEAIVCEETTAYEFVWSLFNILRELFDYIFVDLASRLNRATYEVIDESDIFIMIASSLEYEQPIGIVGHHNFRLVLNLSDESPDQAAKQQSDYYVLPRDPVALETFRRSGIPFVIQSPYRPISQTIGRLARDVGEKQFGLALTGGAALGLTQLGILEVLERNRIAIDIITGASFGAFIGAAHATGIGLRRLTHHIVEWAQSRRSLSRFHFMSSFLKGHFLKEAELQALCDMFLKNTYFEELLIPVNIVAMDTRTGNNVVFREGKVLDAVKSSMRIPGLFVPFKDTERHLIDGSVIYPTPVLPLKKMGAHIKIAIAVMPTPAESQQYFRRKIKGRLTQERRAAKQNYLLVAATFDSLMERLPDVPDSPDIIERVSPDLTIRPEVEGFTWRDFHRVNDLIECGIQAAEKIISKIEELKWG